MGGMRESGMGRRQGAEGIHRYTEAQAVGTQRVWGFRPPVGVSNERFANVLTLSARMMKKLGRAGAQASTQGARLAITRATTRATTPGTTTNRSEEPRGGNEGVSQVRTWVVT